MILIDSSAWIEFLRATGSAQDETVDRLIASEASVATTDVVLMEVLAGARHDNERDQLRKLLYGRCAFLPLRGPHDFERAAELYRECRLRGETVRKLTDCLIAVVAIRADAELLHRNGDFATIARHTPLRVVA